MELTFTLSNLADTVSHLLQSISSKTLLFYGEMGVGKTTIIKEIVKQLGHQGVASSPTFSLVNEYEIPKGCVYHFDCYRINDPIEALDIGIEEYFDSQQWVLIEWPEKIAPLLPNANNKLFISQNKDGTRTLLLK